MANITLTRLTEHDWEQFILDNQWAFKYGAMEEFGERDNHLDILFVNPTVHSRGVGYAAWKEVERLYPETKVWETCTPYFEIRNIHFYVNKCGFHIVEFYNSHHPDPYDSENREENSREGGDLGAMFRFEKQMQ